MVAVVFPGQGSQHPGMGKSLYDETQEGRKVFDTVSQATGLDVAEICFRFSPEELRKTENAQIALFTCSLAAWSALSPRLSAPVGAFAGHSVGEYAAIVAAGALGIEEGARLVRKRGEIMAVSGRAKPGTMAAVLGLERDELEKVCREVAGQGVCVVANDNCPGQAVISGDTNAVHAASAVASERGARKVIPLNVSGAFHSPLMEDSAREMSTALGAVQFAALSQGVSVYANVTAGRCQGAIDWASLLEQQLRSPVRWAESVRTMCADGATTFVECGAGEVLCGLIRRIAPESTTLKVVDSATLEDAVGRLSAVPA